MPIRHIDPAGWALPCRQQLGSPHLSQKFALLPIGITLPFNVLLPEPFKSM